MFYLEEFSSPFFVLSATGTCRSCKQVIPVVGLASGDGQPFMLTKIKSLPEPILKAMQRINLAFQFSTSDTGESSYLVNQCSCGDEVPDFFLFAEPDGAFLPTTAKRAEQVTVYELPEKGAFRIDCSPGMGSGDLILKHGKRVPVQL